MNINFKLIFINQNWFQYTNFFGILRHIFDVNHKSVNYQTDSIPNFAALYYTKIYPDEKDFQFLSIHDKHGSVALNFCCFHCCCNIYRK